MKTVLVKYEQIVDGVRADLWTTEIHSKIVKVNDLTELNDIFRKIVDVKILCSEKTEA